MVHFAAQFYDRIDFIPEQLPVAIYSVHLWAEFTWRWFDFLDRNFGRSHGSLRYDVNLKSIDCIWLVESFRNETKHNSFIQSLNLSFILIIVSFLFRKSKVLLLLYGCLHLATSSLIVAIYPQLTILLLFLCFILSFHIPLAP